MIHFHYSKHLCQYAAAAKSEHQATWNEKQELSFARSDETHTHTSAVARATKVRGH